MKIIVFGPTGGTGRLLVAQALFAGHAVTVFARNAAAFAPAPGLKIIVGSVLDPAAVDAAIAGHDAVLSALGGKPFHAGTLCATATGHMLSAMECHDVRRIIAISTFGAAETRAQVGWFAEHLIFGFVLKGEVADKEAMEEKLEASTRDWTVVRINRLTDKTATGIWRAADDGSIRGMGTIARADVAAFIIDELTRNAWIRRKPVLRGLANIEIV